MQSAPPPPQVLAGRFRIDSLLGTGGFGAVYVATDLQIGRRVAVKMLHPELASQPDQLERLREEAFSLASLHHPNIVQLYDFHAGGPNGTFMVMELVEGESLANRLSRQPTLPFDVAVDYAQQLLSALSAAHARGIVHRDIKPANILVMSVPARRDLVKVLDFGIAKLTEETIRRRPTTAGMLLGTPTYMSPEQAAGRPVDPRSDIYSVGLVLYRMLAGMNPFEGFDLPTTLHRVQSVVPPALTRLRGDAPEQLTHAVSRAIAKNPDERFPSAIDFAQTLGGGSMMIARASATPPVMSPAPHHDPSTVTFGPGQAPLMLDRGQGSAPLARSAPPGTTLPSATLGGAAASSGPPSKGIFLIGLGVGFAVMLLVGLTAAVAWLISKQNPDAVAQSGTPSATAAPAAPEAGAAPPPNVSGSGSAAVKTPPPPSKSGATKTTDEAPGGCHCLPDEGNTSHGNNQKMSAKFPAPMTCRCSSPGLGTLCQKPFVDGSCNNREFSGRNGAKCKGLDSLGGQQEGVADCDFDITQTYAGPRGKTCKGFLVDGKFTDGHVFCPAGR